MSTPCICGEPLHPDHQRCSVCGAPASPGVDETVSLGPAAEAQDVGAPPWSIPIRDPRRDGRQDRPGRPRTAGLTLLAVAAFALTVAVGTRLLDDGDAGTPSEDVAGTEPTSTDVSFDVGPGATRTKTTTTTTAAPTTDDTTAPAPSTSAAPAAVAAPTTAPPPVANGGGSVPTLSTSFRGWVAQLSSVPYSAGSDRLEDAWRTARADAPGAVAARSDDWSALRDGFWVLVEPGPFASVDEVRSFCTSAGMDSEGECLPRELRS